MLNLNKHTKTKPKPNTNTHLKQLLIRVSVSLCTTVIHNTAQNGSISFPLKAKFHYAS